MVRRVYLAMIALSVVALNNGAWAQAAKFPEPGKNITIIVPYAAGGSTDTGARLLAEGLKKVLDVPVLVANRPGAAQVIGLTEMLRKPADGYTIAYTVMPTAMNNYLDPSRPPPTPFTRKDFYPLAVHFFTPQVIAVRTDSKYQTLNDLVEAARAAPGQISIGDPALTSQAHLMLVLLEEKAGVRFNSVHFNGGAPAVVAGLGGHTDAVGSGGADLIGLYRSKEMRVLAASEPYAFMPDVKTMKELGYDFFLPGSASIVAQADLPPAIADVYAKAIKAVVTDPAHVKRLHDLGIDAGYRDSAEFSEYWVNLEKTVGPLLKRMHEAKR
jgi:tripartite-type tricarboxylate transporter receptor subunit TctC